MTEASIRFTDDFVVDALRHYRLQHRARRPLMFVKDIMALLLAVLAVVGFAYGPLLLGLFFVGLCFLLTGFKMAMPDVLCARAQKGWNSLYTKGRLSDATLADEGNLVIKGREALAYHPKMARSTDLSNPLLELPDRV